MYLTTWMNLTRIMPTERKQRKEYILKSYGGISQDSTYPAASVGGIIDWEGV